MSFLLNYVYNFLNTSEVNNLKENNNCHIDENIEDDCYLIDKKYIITKELLGEINLKPPKTSIKTVPFDKVNLKCLSKAQLSVIMNVKLKPIPKIEKNRVYIPRHPVLKEMSEKIKIKY